jgi:lipoate-protein ligase A
VSLPVFGFVTRHHAALAEGMALEAEWMAGAAATGRAAAHLWQGAPGLVAPRSVTQEPGWAAAAARFPVQVRSSGGGLVPQGPGIWNLSLAWPAGSATPTGTDALYRSLCEELAAAFARLGLHTEAQAVEGSFCDGRYNLAAAGRKLVGTAQSWRRVDKRPVVLVHALVVVTADPEAITARANAFEAALGSGRHYRADALTSVARALGAAPTPEFEARVLQALAERFARIIPPHLHEERTHGPA